jgi:hypothetical protein
VGGTQDGALVVSTQQRPPDGAAAARSMIFIYTVDRDGRVTGQFGPFPDRDLGQNGLGLGFGSQAHVAVGRSLIWSANSSRFDLHGFDGDGSLRRIVRWIRDPVPVSDSDLVQAREYVRQDLARQRPSQSALQRILATEYASTFPVHGGIVADAAGNLWVERFTSHMLPARGPKEWDVFDGAGSYLGGVEIPEGLRITQIGTGFLLGVHTDELGVERVLMYGL